LARNTNEEVKGEKSYYEMIFMRMTHRFLLGPQSQETCTTRGRSDPVGRYNREIKEEG
jgi:hypothetical protein